jgi:hypothetical protein
MLKSLFSPKRLGFYEVAICCIAKNEGPYIREWIDYHIQIGVSRFYIYDNESREPLSELLSDYIRNGTVRMEQIKGVKKQLVAYQHCLDNYGSECQWIAFIDVDEYIVPKTCTSIVDFLSAYKPYAGLGVNWLVFGSNGMLTPPSSGTQLENYTRRALRTNPINTHIKSIVQPRYVRHVSTDPHRFVFQRGKYCVNENFEPIYGPLNKNCTAKIQLNHYFLRSLEEFKQKMAKGRADGGELRTIEQFYGLDKEANLVVDENVLEVLLLLEKNKKMVQPVLEEG